MYHMRHVMRKPIFGDYDQVQHKAGCTAIEDGWRLEISELGTRGIVISTYVVKVKEVICAT